MTDTIRTPKRRTFLLGGGLLAAGAAFGPAFPAGAAAPFLGSITPTHRRFRLGAYEVTTILDASPLIGGPWPIVGEDRPENEVRTLMRERLLPEAQFRPGFTPTVVNTGSELILFDAGNGANGFVERPDGGRLAELLRTAGFAPEAFDLVVISHAHPDHIGGLLENDMPLFPKARYAIGAREYKFWSSDDRLAAAPGSLERHSAELLRTGLVPMAERTRFLEPGDAVAPGITAIEAFGHTPGHLAFHVESEGRQLLIWGDCAHHEVASLAHPEWHVLFDMDKQQGVQTRRRIYAMAAADRLPVIGYHMSFPSVGYIEPAGGAYRWLPETYQLALQGPHGGKEGARCEPGRGSCRFTSEPMPISSDCRPKRE